MGSWVPLQIMSAALDPHCWKATSLADPEYVMDFRSPNAFCALAITVFASCAMAFPHRNARQIATTATFFTAIPPFMQSKTIPAGVIQGAAIPPRPIKTATYSLPWNLGDV